MTAGEAAGLMSRTIDPYKLACDSEGTGFADLMERFEKRILASPDKAAKWLCGAGRKYFTSLSDRQVDECRRALESRATRGR